MTDEPSNLKIMDVSPESFTASLREESFHILLRCAEVGAIGLLLFGLPGLVGTGNISLAITVGAFILVTARIGRATWRFGWYRAGVLIFLTGLVGSVACTMPMMNMDENPFIFFTPIAIGIASLLLHPTFGFVIATVALMIYSIVSFSLGNGHALIETTFLASVVLNYLSAAVTWLSARGFMAAVEWSIDSYYKVERREAQLYASEKQLQRALHEKNILNSQLQQVNRDVERARIVAEEANRMKSRFVANMSHELRTPLNGIIGLSYILKQEIKGQLNPEQHNYLERVYEAGEHLIKLLNDILDNAKLEAGRVTIQPEAVQPELIFQEALTMTHVLIGDKPIELIEDLDADLPDVFVDRVRVTQVLLNLLSNAVKFTEHGTITVRASCDAVDRQCGQMMIAIIDTGVGIAPEHQHLIFEEFRQADDSLSRRYGGTGLGLPISRRLVELHGGTLEVTSQIGVGSTFFFTLPIATAEQIAAAQPVDSLSD
jgi:signal transduction histidine kinase